MLTLLTGGEGGVKKGQNQADVIYARSLIITESKLDSTIPDNLIVIPGYHQPIRHDRFLNGRQGGGVLMYIAEHLVFTHKKELQSEFYQHIWADVKIGNSIYTMNAFFW